MCSTYVVLRTACLWNLFLQVIPERVTEEKTEDFSFDGLPGAQHEFKIEVPASQEECFVQRVAQNANLYASFEVLRGGDRIVDFYVKDGYNNTIKEIIYKSEGSIEYTAPVTGNYQICVQNIHSRFLSKLVYIYIVTVVEEEWTKYVAEIEGLHTTVQNFTTSISEVQKSIDQVRLHQATSRMNVIKDWYLLTGNNAYVMYWSVFQIVSILATSCFQVYFVRKLFNIPNVTPSFKPRA
ncbi:transmembrane emp24 domain-containing protein 6-like [Saccostrea cucullata]|uniref:transmembrane emp24 domain-containing protein 6-like n=1 Tax=Saccostrea cuccullata TaxID=36930 RepID=UPI002ED53CE4